MTNYVDIIDSLKTKWDGWHNIYHFQECILGSPDGPDDYLKECDCDEIEDEVYIDHMQNQVDMAIGCYKEE